MRTKHRSRHNISDLCCRHLFHGKTTLSIGSFYSGLQWTRNFHLSSFTRDYSHLGDSFHFPPSLLLSPPHPLLPLAPVAVKEDDPILTTGLLRGSSAEVVPSTGTKTGVLDSIFEEQESNQSVYLTPLFYCTNLQLPKLDVISN